MTVLPTNSPSTVEVHGHRGCRGLLPENTLPAFLHALALGVDVLELDVIISKDQQVVVSHEPWLAAHLGRNQHQRDIQPASERMYNLYEMPYATIQQCLVGEWPHPGFPAQQPVRAHRPLLREVIRKVEAASQQMGRPPVRYSVELKSALAGDGIYHPKPAVFVQLVVTELQAAAVLSRTTLLSFDPRILQASREAYPALKLALLLEDSLPPLPTLFAELGFVPDTLGPDFQLLTAAVAQQLQRLYPGLRLVPWTVNTVSDLQQVIKWDVAGITTDYPNRLLQLVGR